MKTGVIAYPLDRPVGGGIDRYVHRLAKEFHLGPAPGEFVWIHGRPFDDASSLKGAKEAILPERGLGGLIARREWGVFNPEKLDVNFGPYFGVLRGPFKKVMTVHDLYAFTSNDAGWLWTQRFRSATKAMARMCDYIIADSEASRQQALRFLGGPAGRVVTVHLGVDPVAPLSQTERAFARAELRKRYGWPQDARVVLFVGALIPRKDPMLLLRAFAQAHAQRTDLRLLMLGAQTRATPPLRDEAARLGVLDAMAMPGPASEPDLRAAYAGSDVFALPSRFEGFGLPVLEAMTHGLPVVCSTAGSLLEVVGNAAVTFPAGDEKALREGLEAILDDEAAAKGFSLLGLERARPFTWERCAAETYAVLERAAKR